MRVLQFLAAHRAEFAGLLVEHLFLVAVSTGAAIIAGVPLGILAARRPRLGAPIVWVVNAAQTIPSLAMFGFLLPLPFIGGLGARVGDHRAHRLRPSTDRPHDGGGHHVG